MRRTALMFTLAAVVGAVVAVPIAVYASHSFNDVPSSNTFHEDITWLKEAGVTLGCNPPANTEFCPGDDVTREQMSAFMRRLARYMNAEDGTPAQADNATNADHADNAAGLDGYAAAELGPRAAFDSIDLPPNGQDLTLSTEITAPSPGVLIVAGTVNAYISSGAEDLYSCRMRVDGGIVPGTDMGAFLDSDGNSEEDCTTTAAITVDAGTHDIDFEVFNVAAEVNLYAASTWALWVPFDGTGAVPTSFTHLADPPAPEAAVRIDDR